MADKTPKHKGYGAESITVLEGLEPVRKRPGMYIGSTGTDGLHHLIWEIFDNSRDEAMTGNADEIEVVILPGNIIRVADNGRGIPVDIHPKTKVSALETVLTVLHAGGKFDQDSYAVSGGLHGVGASVVNALSEWLTAEVFRDGGKYRQEYARGKRGGVVKKVSSSKLHGTIITFKPDAQIFSELEYTWQKVVAHLRQQAYLCKGLRIRVMDAREHDSHFMTKLDDVFWVGGLELEVPSQSFYFDGGLLSLIKFYNMGETPLHKVVFYVEKQFETVSVEVALQYIDDITPRETSFANNTPTNEGGMHLTGFRTALTRILNDYSRKNGIIKESEDNFTGDDVREGMTAVVSVKLPDPQFEGRPKSKLGSVVARSAVETVFGESFSAFLEEHPDDARSIIGKVYLALKARKAAKAAKDSVLRKGMLEGFTLPGKLADCQTKSAEESELFIVEGDSAGGCFSGNTKVALADGRNVSFEELVREHSTGKKNYCYTIGKNNDIEIASISHPRVTMRAANVVKVVLDNGEEIVCTPDHKFMLRDGSYKKAHELTTSDSIMPLRRQVLSGDRDMLKESVANFNHRIIRVEHIEEKHDVYDLEVAGTHNFALASGVFVHNSSKQGRDRRTQAILPLRGKILNVERARLDKMLESDSVKSLIIAMGTAIGDTFDISKLRYHKIIMATDADVDGAHIRTLLMTLFFRYFPQLIEHNHIYIAQPPLFKLKKGKEAKYAYSDAERDEVAKEMGIEFGSENVQRYKGLGEMNPEELWETTMDPARRILKKVTVADAEEASKTFDILMGNDVAPRKLFIQTHAKLATIDA